ncbi:MAG: aminotransferase class I/II-fold pyridoxal phosphate-dependent enzyme [Dermatophilaceae bacterium]|nr:aminotransferase class I/II-fold pyridoxal phosphate-dependent enzyme [Dermatophilaceae bacterium]
MEADQSRTPVLDTIRELREQDTYTFALPGHRFGLGVDDHTAEVLSRDTFGADVIMAKSSVSDAEELYAQAVGARQAVFTTCGSSISIHVGLLTIAGPGKTILIDRNVHKSVVASLVLAGANPVWLRPSWDEARQVAHPATTSVVEKALEAHPEAAGVLLITPTEYGTGADVAGVADLCHARGIPLMVDEAWGGHFGFHPDPPTAAVKAGADLAVQSLHKADGGLCQASMILVGGDLVDPVDLRLRLDLITTTSPSALLYGSIDGWRRHLALDGKELIDGALKRAAALRERLGAVEGLRVDGAELLDTEGVAEWDPLKLCVDVSGLGITGYTAKSWLMDEKHLAAQLGDARRLVFSLTYADDDAAMDRLATAVEELAARPPHDDAPAPRIPPLHELDLEQAMSPRDAFFAETEQVADPVGRICAEMVSPYPPGVPAVLPGERFNEAVTDYLRAAKAAGATIPDASDPELETFRVVRSS